MPGLEPGGSGKTEGSSQAQVAVGVRRGGPSTGGIKQNWGGKRVPKQEPGNEGDALKRRTWRSAFLFIGAMNGGLCPSYIQVD
jgi:hypothetical protein